jgi:cytochrome c oxidase cbb3-type subunit 3
MKKLNYFLVFFLLTSPAFAQETTKVASTGNSYMNILITVFIIVAILLLAFAFVLLNTFNILSRELSLPSTLPVAAKVEPLEYPEWAAAQKNKPSIFNKLLGLRPIEEEKDLLIEHEFDGIKELDNPVPGWFNFLFYGSIAVGIMYFITYHVADWGPSQEQEYVTEMKRAEEDQKLYLSKSANKIDETSVAISTEAPVISAGKAVYDANCVACHGDKGQGTVGPNLSDEYWLHGGKITNVFKTIKYGVPEKGMISWEKTLSPKQISEVSNYIMTLKGTSPANAKVAQGEKES